MMENAVKLFPGWREAADRIVERVTEQGYGVIFSHDDLLKMMDIKLPEMATPDEYKKYSLEVMTSTVNLTQWLLHNHNLCLHNVRGQGYQILHPDDQVTIAADKRFKMVAHHLGKAVEVLTRVDQEALSHDGQQAQLRGLGKAAFLISGFSKKRKFPGEGGSPAALPE